MILMSVAFLLAQILLLFYLVSGSPLGAPGGYFYRLFNPYGFLALFYSMFFILPQIYGIFHDFYLVASASIGASSHAEPFLTTQVYLVVFLGLLLVGQTIAALTVPRSTEPFTLKIEPIPTPIKAFVWLLFILGVYCTLRLGAEWQQTGGFRSNLVKSMSGKVLTTLSFLANFAFTALTVDAVKRRKYLTAVVIFVIFAFAVLTTGARGRLLWPMAFSIIVIATSGRRMSITTLVVFAVVALVSLPFLDSVQRMMSGDKITLASEIPLIDLLFQKRNFDGFANFALILNGVYSEPSLGALFGARDTFMTAYFPATYAAGVGFGATVPGWFYLSGGILGFLILSLLFGVALGVMTLWLHRTRSIWSIYAYLFAIIWITQVGGNVPESLDKMVAASFPAIFIHLMTKTRIHTERTARKVDRIEHRVR